MNRLLYLLFALVLGGCAAMKEPAAFKTLETSQSGTLRWNTGKMVTVGQIVVAKDTDRTAVLQFFKEAPTPLLEIRMDSTMEGIASGRLPGAGWRGPVANVPEELELWFGFLQIWLDTPGLPAGNTEIHTASSRAICEKAGRKLRSLSLRNTEESESLTAIFNP